MKRTWILLTLMVAPLLWACGNDDESSRIELLCRAAWKYTDANCSSGGQNTITFKTDGTCILIDGCDTSIEAVEEPGTWTFLENETKISVSGAGYTQVYDIVELTESSFVIKTKGGPDQTEVENRMTH